MLLVIGVTAESYRAYTFYRDATAARDSLLAAQKDLDVTHMALFDSGHAERLRGTGAAGRAVAELADFFLEFHRQRYRFDGAPIHDAMAVAHVIDPSLVETLHCNVEIETQSEFCDGRTVVDRWLVRDAPKNAEVGIDVDAERFLDLLVSRLASLP